MPTELAQANLQDITAQPLLNYLVALSYMRGTVQISETSNLNEIYADLLGAVYERGWASDQHPELQGTRTVYKRGWADNQHPALQGIEESHFVRILEEVALAAWHGDGRTTTVKAIEAHCDNSGLKGLLAAFQEGTKAGVTRLLMAFYFRQSGSLSSGEKTFEFTHKSFGEYLTARRIVNGIDRIHTELERRRETFDGGWDERQALAYWAALCGPSAMDEYLFSFLCNEVRLHDKDQGEPMAKDALSLDRGGIRARLADGTAKLADLS